MGGTQRGRADLRHAILDAELGPHLKGFKVRLMLQDQAPDIGSGNRLVVVQFRGKKVVLHCAGCTQAIKRDVFKDVIFVKQRYRKRNGLKPHRRPKLQLVVSNPIPKPATEAA